jgi:hypothetical protein
MNEAGDMAVISITNAKQGEAITVNVTSDITDIPYMRGLSGSFIEVANNLESVWPVTFNIGDWTNPVLTAMVPEADNNTLNTFVVDLFFSEEVVGVADAVDVDGGDLVSVEVDDDDATIYHVTVTGEDLAVITVTVDAAGITDGPINFNGLVMAAGVDGVGDYVVVTMLLQQL